MRKTSEARERLRLIELQGYSVREITTEPHIAYQVISMELRQMNG